MSEQAKFSIQIACDNDVIPAESQFALWQQTALTKVNERRSGVTIRIVSTEEMTILNYTYRGNKKVTNVLSFPFDLIEGVEIDWLGDIAICAEVIIEEAATQKKTVDAHWAHMTVHGVLHLCGYDHVDENEAIDMETLEVEIMAELDYPNPYLDVIDY